MSSRIVGIIFLCSIILHGCTSGQTETTEKVIQEDSAKELQNVVSGASELIKKEKYNDAYWLLRSFEENHEVDQNFETLKNYVQAKQSEKQGNIEMQITYLEKIPANYNGILSEEILKEQGKIGTLKSKVTAEKNAIINAENEKLLKEVIPLITQKKYDEAMTAFASLTKESSQEHHVLSDYNGALWSLQHGYEDSLLSALNKIPDNYTGHFEKEIKALKKKYVSQIAEYVGTQYRVSQLQAKENPRIGMTSDEVRNSRWGNPQKINKTTTANGTREQWVYSINRYLYFEDDVLTAIQE